MIVCKNKTTGRYAIADWCPVAGDWCRGGFWSVWREARDGPQIRALTGQQFKDLYDRVTEFIQPRGPSAPEFDTGPASPPPTRRWQDVTAEELADELERYPEEPAAISVRATATRLAEQDPPEVA